MTTSSIDKSQRTAAKVVAFAYLITFATVVYVHYGILWRLITENVAETARNILGHEQFFRTGVALNILYCAGIFVLLTALYVVLKPVNKGLALLAAFWWVVYAFTWLFMSLNYFDALRLLKGADPLQAFDAQRLQALAGFTLHTNFDIYYIGLLFWGLASTVCACLWFKSRYIPRALAAFGVVSSAFAAVCSFALFINPHFDKIVGLGWFDTPIGLFDLALSFWLLFKGLKPSGTAEARA
ncbi:MAG TPA: DUF4386 domain-containing protein [Terracidiphilus sp.]|nr:DUF4386 domain-containing protein [Terracidiphilus sp.]